MKKVTKWKNAAGSACFKARSGSWEDPEVKIPHIGWNRLEVVHPDTILSAADHPFVYYVHSYRAQDHREEDLVAYSMYGSLKIPGYVRHGNILGMQYHPEKSGEDGLDMLRRFAALCEEGRS